MLESTPGLAGSTLGVVQSDRRWWASGGTLRALCRVTGSTSGVLRFADDRLSRYNTQRVPTMAPHTSLARTQDFANVQVVQVDQRHAAHRRRQFLEPARRLRLLTEAQAAALIRRYCCRADTAQPSAVGCHHRQDLGRDGSSICTTGRMRSPGC